MVCPSESGLRKNVLCLATKVLLSNAESSEQEKPRGGPGRGRGLCLGWGRGDSMTKARRRERASGPLRAVKSLARRSLEMPGAALNVGDPAPQTSWEACLFGTACGSSK